VRVFGIDPGCERTGYGCVETDGSRHRIVLCGAITSLAIEPLPEKLQRIHTQLTRLLADCRPASVAIENLFFSVNVRSALKLGHARGVAMLAAVEAGLPVFEYTPAEVKRGVVGYGRADKAQVQQMVRVLLGLDAVPSPHDAADALAIAICHVHANPAFARAAADALRRGKPASRAAGPLAVQPARSKATSWSAFAREREKRAPDALRRDRRVTPASPRSTADALRRGKPERS
jgi:crossover junction endodeoxyribonuclease RuvC